MTREIWLNKEINLLKTFENEEYDALIKYATENQQYIMTEWHTADDSAFQKIVRFGRSVLQRFECHLQGSSKAIAVFRLGALMGTIESFDNLLFEKKQDDWVNKLFKEEVLSIKHLDEILLLLEIQGVLSHSEICDYLNLKESTLSEIMKKIGLTKLISFSRSGRYKLYRLTDEGRRLAKQLRKQLNEDESEKEVLLQLRHFLEYRKSTDEFRHKVRELLENDRETDNINPGDSLTIFYRERELVEREEFRVLGIENGKKMNNVRIMAEKRKYDIAAISDNSNNEEVYAL